MEVLNNPLEDPILAADYLELVFDNILAGRIEGYQVPELSATIRDITTTNRYFLLIIQNANGFFPCQLMLAPPS